MRFYAQGYKVFDWIKTFRAMQHENSPESQEWSWFSMLDNHPDVLSFRQVMEITHIGRNLLLRLLNSGEIPAFKMGKLWKVYKQDLIQYMSQCQWALSFVWGKKNPVGLRSRNLAGFDSTGFITNAMLNSTIKNFSYALLLLSYDSITFLPPLYRLGWTVWLSILHKPQKRNTAFSFWMYRVPSVRFFSTSST